MIDYKDFDGPITLENIKGKAVVLDDALMPEDHMMLEKELLDFRRFPWYMGSGNVAGTGEDKGHRDLYLYHTLFAIDAEPSPWWGLFNPLWNMLNPMAFVRVRCNLDIGRSVPHEHGFHNDYDNIVSAVYYVNDNNGATKFENGEVVRSKANRIVFFDSNLRHTTVVATDVRARILVNINYLPSEMEDLKIENQW